MQTLHRRWLIYDPPARPRSSASKESAIYSRTQFTVTSLLSLNLHHDQDAVTARQRAAQIARLLELDASEQTRLATAVSEIVRNAFRYAGHGTVHFEIDV